MHNFMKSIGFSGVTTKKEMDQLIGKVLAEPNYKMSLRAKNKVGQIQLSKDFGKNFGISVVGEYDEKGFLNVEYCFPYYKGVTVSDYEEIQIERHADKESYAGICDDLNVSVSLIFFLQNVLEYLDAAKMGDRMKIPRKVLFAGLAQKGLVILEIQKNQEQKQSEIAGNQMRNNLLAAARAGDLDAIESLTLDDMDMYTIISKRVKHEDIFTIVDSYFMPFGVESDQYAILGNILSVTKQQNELTKEMVYCMEVECNHIIIHVCINEKNLLGEPAVGRRFKGEIWLQGKVLF